MSADKTKLLGDYVERRFQKWLTEQPLDTVSAAVQANAVDVALAVSVGWPSSGGLSTKRRTIGQCWFGSTTADGKPQLFISPLLEEVADAQGVLATLVHEICHVVAGPDAKHGPAFVRVMKKVLLEGKPTATSANADLVERLKQIAADYANKAYAMKRRREWDEAHPERVKANRDKHRASIREGQKRCYKRRRGYYIDAAGKWAKANPERRKQISQQYARRRRFKEYGLTEEQYQKMCVRQAGRCDICRREKRLVIDHCHTRNRVRALLCSGCNLGLGAFRDSPESLLRAVEYLREHAE